MAGFTDRKGNQWRVELDAPTISEIRDEHGVNLVGFEADPLGPLRNDPMKLVTVIAAICQQQISEKALSPIEFARLLPSPPDSMLEAVRDAVIGFFPSGQASHRLEVLAKFEQMASKTNDLATVKMQQILDDPEVMKTLDDKANRVIKQAIQKMSQDAGT